MPLTTFPLPEKCTIKKAKSILKDIFKLDCPIENMYVGNQNKDKIVARYGDDYICDTIEQERHYTTVYEVPTEGLANPVITELTFFKNVTKNKKVIVDMVEGAIPRLKAFDADSTILEVK